MRYKYEIWTKYKHINERVEYGKPSLWVECDTLAQVGRYLNLSVGKVREAMIWSQNGELGTYWHIRNNGIRYQILRKNK